MNWKKYLATAAAAVLAMTAFAGCGSEQESSTAETTAKQTTAATTKAAETEAVTETATEAEKPAAAEEEETTEAPTEAHVSPMETVSARLGAEVSDINVLLDRDTDNTYKADLADFIQDGDSVESFTFIFYAPDGVSNMGSYQGGCGISVTKDCPAATDEGWYQSDDFEVYVNGAYAEINWQVPSDVAPYVAADGEVLIGHWWSNCQQLKLSSIICNYTRTVSVPVDGTETIQPNLTLQYNDEEAKNGKVSLSKLIGEEDALQTVTFDVSAGGPLGKFTGAFGVSLKDGCKAATDDHWYQTGNIAVITSGSNLSLTWIVPDEIKDYIDPKGDVMLGYWWSDQGSVSVDQVSARYSNTTGEASHAVVQDTEELQNASAETADADTVNKMSSAEIVSDIKIGWNLGNTLDCYNVKRGDTETGWGNPKTTQKMIDTVKAAGFNAVRIPVSWTDHISPDGTIEIPWMNRVKEVVDYAMKDNLYVILNVHHDDYTWLTPTYSSQAAVEQKLTHIWEQICDTFGDYDHHLIFEGMNEPRVIGSETEWSGGTPEERDVINQLFASFVKTVRASGGLNADRTLIVTSHAQSITKEAVGGVVVPNDDHIIVSIHSYAPWDFCGPESTRSTWGSDADKKELDDNFKFLSDTFISKGVPVIIDEFGSVNKGGNTADRAAHLECYISTAKKYDIKCFVWDNGKAEEEYALLNRSDCTWIYPSLINAMMRGAA